MNEEAMKELERSRPITIKFAQLDSMSQLKSDAWDMHGGLFDELPNGWMYSGDAWFDTRTERYRRVWAFQNSEAEVELIAARARDRPGVRTNGPRGAAGCGRRQAARDVDLGTLGSPATCGEGKPNRVLACDRGVPRGQP
jgi:hypothetical protein